MLRLSVLLLLRKHMLLDVSGLIETKLIDEAWSKIAQCGLMLELCEPVTYCH